MSPIKSDTPSADIEHECMNASRDPPSDVQWIAIEPPLHPLTYQQEAGAQLPSFQVAQYDVILRRQRQRPKDGGGVKITAVPSRFLHLSNTFEFAGWGTITKVELEPTDLSIGSTEIAQIREAKNLGQFLGSALAGIDILGGVFYTLPAVVAVSGVYSPISLLVATSTLFLWRPIMEELASAFPVSGAPYTYLLSISSKPLAMASATLLLLDFASTSVVSAATAATYLAGEVVFPFPVFLPALLFLFLLTLMSLSGLRESSRIALALLSMHFVTMVVLFIASIVAWARMGNAQLRENWAAGNLKRSSDGVARQLFNGVCIGVLGLTGFECTPSYASHIKPGRFPLVLRNLHYPAILLNVLLVIFLLALVPLDTILSGANVLSVLAENSAGRWLRIWIVVDAVTVLCGGILTGILGACELIERLTRDRFLPLIFFRKLPITEAPIVSIAVFLCFNCILYATSGANLAVVSKMFSLVWLIVMSIFPVAVLLLKFNRGRLPRTPITPIWLVFLTIGVVLTIIGGNIAIDPSTIGYAASYVVVIAAIFYATMKKVPVLHWIFWIYDQTPLLHTFSSTHRWGRRMTKMMRHLRRQPVCLLIKSDEINRLFHKVLYVSQNEETSCLKLVHFFDEEVGVPSEMEANWKILDEAFPEITIDLVLVQGQFNPTTITALAHRLKIPTALMFMSCPGHDFPYSVAECGTRIISL